MSQFFQKAANNPEAYSIRERDLRRVNLETFPYHFLFRIVNDSVRVQSYVITADDPLWESIDANQIKLFLNPI